MSYLLFAFMFLAFWLTGYGTKHSTLPSYKLGYSLGSLVLLIVIFFAFSFFAVAVDVVFWSLISGILGFIVGTS